MRFSFLALGLPAFFVTSKNFSGRRCCCICFFLNHLLLSVMKSKQTAVRGPTGCGRPPETGFYGNPCVYVMQVTFQTALIVQQVVPFYCFLARKS